MPTSKQDRYRLTLRTLPLVDWMSFLLAESGLPGPRGNIELAQAVADEGTRVQFMELLTYGPDRAPVNDPHEFLAFCGAVGLGALLARGESDVLPLLKSCANDPRWRMREGTAMALQRWGLADLPALLAEMVTWAQGTLLERRAAMAGLCEPALLAQPEAVLATLAILDEITASLLSEPDRHSEAFRALRQGLAYGWSVAVAALPEQGKARIERWLLCGDADVRWLMHQNLAKKRLERADPAWVELWKQRLKE